MIEVCLPLIEPAIGFYPRGSLRIVPDGDEPPKAPNLARRNKLRSSCDRS
jgi:hypothetical protein